MAATSLPTSNLLEIVMQPVKSRPMSKDTTDNIALASTYRLLAVGYRQSAETLNTTIETRSDGSPAKLTAIPIYFLISHSAELLLKSALLKRGYAESDLKKFDYRHNLNSLLASLQKKGVTVTPETIFLINGLHSQHQSHALRYSVLTDNGQKTFWPPLPLLFTMLDELLMLTRISTQGV
jgi:hypothetical protein